MDVSAFSYLWTEERADWVLIRVRGNGSDDLGHAIYNVRTQSALLIEDDELLEEVVRHMLKAGARVLDKVPRNEPDRPD